MTVACSRLIRGVPTKAATNTFSGRWYASRGRADLLEHPVAHDRHPVAERHRLGLVVRDVDRGDAHAVGQPGDLGAQVRAQLGVQVGQRLVHQEDRRVPGDRPAHRDPLPLAAGQLPGVAVQDLLDAQDAVAVSSTRGPCSSPGISKPQREADVLPAGHARVEGEVLEDHRHLPVAGCEVVGVLAVEQQFAGGDVLQSRDHPQHGRFSAARRTEQHQELAWRDVQREPVHGGHGCFG